MTFRLSLINISQRLIQAMGGQIELSSEVGKGSVFGFTIMGEPAFELSDQDWYQSQPFYTGKTLLLSCENQTNYRLIAEYVCSWGMKVIAMNERDISQLEQQTFDVAIVDRAIPNLTIPTLIIEAPSSSRKTEKKVLPLPIQPAILDRCLRQILALPTAISESPPSHSLVSVAPTPLDILLVEDNPVNQKVARQMLKRLGYQVTIANNGKEALSILDTHAYDLVFMDMQMPEMDGLEATRQIRQHLQNQPWIIAMTANAMSGDRERCLEAGMNDYLSKPLSLEAMKEKIATVIQRD